MILPSQLKKKKTQLESFNPPYLALLVKFGTKRIVGVVNVAKYCALWKF